MNDSRGRSAERPGGASRDVLRLYVNIDHVATIRQARRTDEPDPVRAAVLAELGGADGITVHLREDRRHIQDRDVRLLLQTVRTGVNLELAAASDVVDLACELKPMQVTLVPEKREEITTEGGLALDSSPRPGVRWTGWPRPRFGRRCSSIPKRTSSRRRPISASPRSSCIPASTQTPARWIGRCTSNG